MEQKIQMTQEPRDGVALREGDFPNRQPPVRALPSGTSLRAVPTLVQPIHGRFSRDATPVSPVGRASGPQLNASCRPVKIALRTSQITT